MSRHPVLTHAMIVGLACLLAGYLVAAFVECDWPDHMDRFCAASFGLLGFVATVIQKGNG